MFDIKSVQAEAEKEIREEAAREAKTKIKDKLQQIAKAKAVVTNLEREYEVLLASIGADA